MTDVKNAGGSPAPAPESPRERGAEAPPTPATDQTPPAGAPAQPRPVNISCTRGLADWLLRNQVSLAFTSYQTGGFYLVGAAVLPGVRWPVATGFLNEEIHKLNTFEV